MSISHSHGIYSTRESLLTDIDNRLKCTLPPIYRKIECHNCYHLQRRFQHSPTSIGQFVFKILLNFLSPWHGWDHLMVAGALELIESISSTLQACLLFVKIGKVGIAPHSRCMCVCVCVCARATIYVIHYYEWWYG
jgi:hypothetical protein